MSKPGIFAGLSFSVGCLTGSVQAAKLVQLNGGSVVEAPGPSTNIVRPDSVAKQTSATARRPILHMTWIHDCSTAQALQRPLRGQHVSVPPSYAGPLVVGDNGDDVFCSDVSADSAVATALVSALESPPVGAVADAADASGGGGRGRTKRPYSAAEHAAMIDW
jgi:hypothetical protein